jgi:integrase
MGKKRRRHRNLPENMRVSHGAYYVTAYVDGKQRWLPLGRDITAAFAKYRELTGAGSPLGKTIDQLVDRYEREVLPGLKDATRKCYRAWIPAIRKTWGAMTIKTLTQPDAAVFLDTYPNKVTANRVVSLLSAMLKKAKRWGLVASNALEGLELNPEAPRKRVYDAAEWAALLLAADLDFARVLRAARFTALRRKDLCALVWGCVKGNRLVVTTSKTAAPLSMEIAGDLAAVLDELRGGTSPFPTRPIFPGLTVSALDYRWAATKKKAGVSGHFHDIRRTRITELQERYGAEFAQKVATHSDPRTTRDYFSPDAVRIDWPEAEIRGTPGDKRQ